MEYMGSKMQEQYEAGNAMYAELEKVTAERDALAAQVGALKDWRDLALKFDGHRMAAMSMLKMVASGAFDIKEVRRFIAAAPVPGNEHLREVKAQAGRDGFVAGALEWGDIGFPCLVEDSANQYADQIRRGGGEVMDKCEKKSGGYASQTCSGMNQLASIFPTKKQKGLFAHSMVNIETGEKLGTAISIRTESAPNGVFLNYCPFCGGELLDQSRFDDEAAKRQGEVG